MSRTHSFPQEEGHPLTDGRNRLLVSVVATGHIVCMNRQNVKALPVIQPVGRGKRGMHRTVPVIATALGITITLPLAPSHAVWPGNTQSAGITIVFLISCMSQKILRSFGMDSEQSLWMCRNFWIPALPGACSGSCKHTFCFLVKPLDAESTRHPPFQFLPDRTYVGTSPRERRNWSPNPCVAEQPAEEDEDPWARNSRSL